MISYSVSLDPGKSPYLGRENGQLSVSIIAHTQPAAPKLERGGATLAQALDTISSHLYAIILSIVITYKSMLLHDVSTYFIFVKFGKSVHNV